MTSAPTALADPLADAHRVVRRLTPPESPFVATLARAGEDAVQLVDADLLSGWEGWSDRGPHVLAPLDVARRQGGHDVVLPWCVERLSDFVDRRARSGVTLTAGEIVTISVSVVRGLRALRPVRGGSPPRGSWWLTDDGRPVFVCAAADASASATGATLETTDASEASDTILLALREAAGATSLARALDRCREMLVGPASMDDLESVVFDIAPPEPLLLAVLAPQRAAALPSRSIFGPVDDPGESTAARGGLAQRLRATLAHHVDADIAELVSDAVHRTRQRVTGARRFRGRPWLVAAGIAAVVVVGGLWWPSGETPAGADNDGATVIVETGADAAVPTPSPGPKPAPEADAPEADGGAATEEPTDTSDTDETSSPAVEAPTGVAGELSALLERRAACLSGNDEGCLAPLFEDPLRTTVPAGPVDLPVQARAITLLDDLGGVAVLRVDEAVSQDATPGVTGTQIVVIVRTDVGWVIRDVRDITPAA